MKAIALEKIGKINAVLSGSTCPHNGLLGGSLGLLYYYYHAAAILQDPLLEQQAEEMLQQVFDEVNNGADARLGGSAYSNGATGFAYTVNNLAQNGLISFDIDSEFTDLDEYLFEAACEQMDAGEIDYLHGATGALHYFAARQQNETTHSYLNTLAARLQEKAVPAARGLYFTNFSLERLGGGKADLGLAHGLSGLLLLLIAAWPQLNDQQQAEQTIRKGIEFILQFEIAREAGKERYSAFPFTIDLARPITMSNRMAWCYGDLNIMLLLYRAGKLLQEESYIQKADAIGLNALNRKSEADTESTDSHFCHGSSGLAQFFKCLYTETGNAAYHEAYEYWIGVTLEQVDKDIAADQYAVNPTSLLDGWAGVALVLADYVSDKKRNWADAFLL